jgi:hypothetical protein
MSSFVVDINDLIKENSNKRLFSGRSNGEDAFKFFKLNVVNENDILELKVPSEVVISSSYFLGMLEKIMWLYDDVNIYKKHVNESHLNSDNLKEYQRAVKRGFYKNRGLV